MLLYAGRILTVALFAQCCIRLSVVCGQMVRCVLLKSCLKKQIGLPDRYPVVLLLIRTKGQIKYALKHRHVNHVWVGLLVTKLQTNFLDCFLTYIRIRPKSIHKTKHYKSNEEDLALELWQMKSEGKDSEFTVFRIYCIGQAGAISAAAFLGDNQGGHICICLGGGARISDDSV